MPIVSLHIHHNEGVLHGCGITKIKIHCATGALTKGLFTLAQFDVLYFETTLV